MLRTTRFTPVIIITIPACGIDESLIHKSRINSVRSCVLPLCVIVSPPDNAG
jgi:hypothetical protein